MVGATCDFRSRVPWGYRVTCLPPLGGGAVTCHNAPLPLHFCVYRTALFLPAACSACVSPPACSDAVEQDSPLHYRFPAVLPCTVPATAGMGSPPRTGATWAGNYRLRLPFSILPPPACLRDTISGLTTCHSPHSPFPTTCTGPTCSAPPQPCDTVLGADTCLGTISGFILESAMPGVGGSPLRTIHRGRTLPQWDWFITAILPCDGNLPFSICSTACLGGISWVMPGVCLPDTATLGSPASTDTGILPYHFWAQVGSCSANYRSCRYLASGLRRCRCHRLAAVLRTNTTVGSWVLLRSGAPLPAWYRLPLPPAVTSQEGWKAGCHFTCLPLFVFLIYLHRRRHACIRSARHCVGYLLTVSGCLQMPGCCLLGFWMPPACLPPACH